MRVTIITDTYPPEINGVAMTLERLATGLARAGHQVEVIRPRAKPRRCDISGAHSLCREREVTGIPIPRYPQLRMALPKPLFLGALWRNHRPDAIYVATEGLLGLSAIHAARRLRIPIISGYHTHFPDYLSSRRLSLLGPLARRYLRILHNRTHVTLAPSEDVIAHLRATGYRRVTLLGRGVDADQFHPRWRSERLRESWGAEATTPVALYVGRVAHEKNLPLALDAARRHGLKFVLVGDGPAMASLRSSYPEAIWAGALRGTILAAHYASADLFLFPSRSETYGNVLVEAMASGLPTLSFHYAASAALVEDGANGFTVPFGETEAFSARLGAALSERARWPEIGNAAREKAAALDWDTVIARFAHLLRRQVEIGSRQRQSVTPGKPYPTNP